MPSEGSPLARSYEVPVDEVDMAKMPSRLDTQREIVSCLLMAENTRNKLIKVLGMDKKAIRDHEDFSDAKMLELFGIAQKIEERARREHSESAQEVSLQDYLEDRERLEGYLRKHGYEGGHGSLIIKALLKGEIIDSVLSLSELTNILTQLVQDLPEALALRASVLAEKEAERMKTETDARAQLRADGLDDEQIDNELLRRTEERMRKPVWATVATTTPVELKYATEASAREKILALQTLGVSVDPPEPVLKNGKWMVRMTGSRVSFAWHKPQCSFRDACEDGCRFCVLSGPNTKVKSDTKRVVEARMKKMTADERGATSIKAETEKFLTEIAMSALEDGLASTAALGNRRTVFELLPDGNFLNPSEVPVATQNSIMRRLAQEPSLHRVAMETRIEHLRASDIERLVGQLHPDQELEIYIGLESTDEGVSALLNKKGYGFKEFKDKLLPLKNLPATLKDRIKLTTYNIVKPPYLNEVRSVQLAVKMVEDIHNFSKNELGMTIEVKHEPTVISDGSQEALLHSQRTPEGKRRFEVLSYFSVAELLAQLIEKKLNHLSKFGQRDDMDSFRDVSMIVSLLAENMFSPFDFMVYNAIQRYNTTRDVKGFLLDIRIPILRSEEFQIWEQSFCGKENSALSRLVRDEFFTQSGDPRPLTEAEQKREGFQVNLWHILNNIEYNAEISGHIRSHGKPSTEWFQQKARETFEQGGINVLFVRNPIFVDNGKGDPNIPLLSGADVHPSYRGNPKAEKEEDRLPATERATYQVEVIVTNETGDPQSLWMIVPLKTVEAPKVNISEPLGRNRLRSPAASSAEMARV